MFKTNGALAVNKSSVKSLKYVRLPGTLFDETANLIIKCKCDNSEARYNSV